MSDANTGGAGGGKDEGLNLRQTLSEMVTSAVNLRVTTVVGDVVMAGRIEDMTVSAPTGPAKALITNIDLLRGDVTTVVSPDLLGDAYKDLVTRHYAAVDSAQKNVKDNIAAFADMLGGVRNALLPGAKPRDDKGIAVSPGQP